MRRGLAVLVATAACGRVGFDDGRPADAAPVDADMRPAIRVVAEAHWTSWFGPTFGSGGMTMTGYSLPTAGVVDGELLLIVACIDNGSNTVWPTPLAPGFSQIFQMRWGNDGQTCAVNTKIAAGEPAEYTGTYGPGIVSGSAVLALLAMPTFTTVGDYAFFTGSGNGTNPVAQSSTGVTTTKPDSLVLYMSASDWECFEATDVTFTTPAGFTPLFLETDQGGTTTKDWTAFQLATKAMPVPGATGTIASTESSTGTAACKGLPWTGAIALEP